MCVQVLEFVKCEEEKANDKCEEEPFDGTDANIDPPNLYNILNYIDPRKLYIGYHGHGKPASQIHIAARQHANIRHYFQ